MRDKIDICQPKTVENPAEFFGAFEQPNGASACFMSPVHDDAPGFAQCTYLARIDNLQVFEYSYEDYGLSPAYIYQWHIKGANRHTPPESLNILNVGVKRAFVNVRAGWGAHFSSCASVRPGCNMLEMLTWRPTVVPSVRYTMLRRQKGTYEPAKPALSNHAQGAP